MVRLLLLLSLLLSIIAFVPLGCSGQEAPTVSTRDAVVGRVGASRSTHWEATYGDEVTLYGWLNHVGSAKPVMVGFYLGPSSIPDTPASTSCYPHHCAATGTAATSSIGPFEGEVMSQVSIQPDTTYYYRAYAQSTAGIAWGDEYSFHTCPASVLTVTLHTADVGPNGISGVTGEAFNRTNQTLTHAAVTADFKCPLGQLLATASYNTDNVDIAGVSETNPDGGRWTFDIRCPLSDSSNCASYELSFSAW